jgi:hypothetical protein
MAVIEALCDALLRVGVVRALVSACGKEAPAELREQAPHPSPNPLPEPYPLTPYPNPNPVTPSPYPLAPPPIPLP